MKAFPLLASLLVFSAPSLAKNASEPEEHFYVVKERGEALSLISTRLYGTCKRWKKIAAWNGIEAPYRVRVGQKLKLQIAPTLSQEQGDQELLNLWRKRFKLQGEFAGDSKWNQVSVLSYKEALEKIAPPKPELKNPNAELTAEEHLEAGQKLFEEKQYEKALPHFQKSRKMKPELMPPWFFEMKTLRQLGKKKEESETRSAFLSEHPQMKNLPMFKEGAAP